MRLPARTSPGSVAGVIQDTPSCRTLSPIPTRAGGPVPEQVYTPVVPRQASSPGLVGVPQTIQLSPAPDRPSRVNQIVAAAGILAAAAVIALFLAPWGPQLLDLEVYRFGGSTLLHGGDLYGVVYPGTDLAFTYPVFAAMLFVPFAVMPTVVAHALVLTLSL